MKIRFAIVGSGWRSKFYIRISKEMSDTFELTSMLFRKYEKSEKFRYEFGIPTTTSRKELIESKPDFVVVAVNKKNIFNVTKEYLELGIPVLAETPAGLTEDELSSLWNLQTKRGCKVQIAEQYFLFPYYKELLKSSTLSKIGTPRFVQISAIHDYHAASIIRRLLGIKFQQFKISGSVYNFPIIETDSRDGKINDGRSAEKSRIVITLDFGEKTAFYNFSNVQYHSDILSKQITVQGERGEIHNDDLLYIDMNNSIKKDKLIYSSLGPKDDEKAISQCLIGMMEYIKTGKEFYPLAEALQDSYISILLHRAVDEDKICISKTQIWHNAT